MRVLLDTNVVLDVLLRRGEWLDEAEVIWQASVDERLIACLTASSLTDIYYIGRRLVSASAARQAVRQCLDCLRLLLVDRDVLEQAYALPTVDFEDALQIAAAVRHGADAIVARDASGFADSPITVLSPIQLAAHLRTSS